MAEVDANVPSERRIRITLTETEAKRFRGELGAIDAGGTMARVVADLLGRAGIDYSLQNKTLNVPGYALRT